MSVKYSASWLVLMCFHKLSCFDFAFSPCIKHIHDALLGDPELAVDVLVKCGSSAALHSANPSFVILLN